MTQYPENILARRYASHPMVALWSEVPAILAERLIWTEALAVQEELGVATPEGAVVAYRAALVADVDLDRIADIERTTNHDVLARREAFNGLVKLELAHRSFTSRDLTENREQACILHSLNHVRNRCYAVLDRFRRRALEWQFLDVCGRSHGQPGQGTTYGKRMASLADELIDGLKHLDDTIASYRFRGFKGAMGTQQDLITLLGSQELALEFERILCERLGFTPYFESVGQVYPRSQDFGVMATLFQLTGAFGNFSRLVRDNARLRHLIEGFSEGRKGSSAMPHKQNPSKSERIKGLKNELQGSLNRAATLVGEQEFEGDVSCSVPRRVMWPDAFFAMDGIIETTLTVLDQMEVFPAIIEAELNEELSFLSTTAIRAALRHSGIDDTTAYEIIQTASKAASTDIRHGMPNTLLQRLSNDKRVPLGLGELRALCVPNHGAAVSQVERVVRRISEILKYVPTEIIEYTPTTRN